jgi:hypothetical protein
MPVAATGLAEVGARDLKPLVLGRRRQHPLEQLAVGGLGLGPLAQGMAGVGEPVGEGVAHLLQLTEADQARLVRRGRDPGVDRHPREGLSCEARKLALEVADLAPQLRTREALVAPDAKAGKGLSVEQLRHEPLRV